MKTIAYVRRSTTDKNKQIQSIPKQINWCNDVAKKHEYTIDHFFSDKGSAHKPGRGEFMAMMEMVNNTKEPVRLIAWKISRLARNPIDEGMIKYAFMQKKIQHILTGDREYNENANHIIMGVDFGQACQSSVELSRDVKQGMTQKAERGLFPGFAPVGYRNEKYAPKGAKRVLPDETWFPIIEKVLRTMLKGIYNGVDITNLLNDTWQIKTRKGKKWNRSTVYRILTNPFYTGYFIWDKKRWKGKHKPMITFREHQKILALLGQDVYDEKKIHSVKKSKHQGTFAGLLTCGHCNGCISGYTKKRTIKDGSIKRYEYWRCNKHYNPHCPEKNIPQRVLDTQVLEQLEQIKIPLAFEDWLLRNILHISQNDKGIAKKTKQHIQTKKKEIQQQKKEIGRKLRKGVITDNMYQIMIEDIHDDEQQLEQERALYDDSQEKWIQNISEYCFFSRKVKKSYIRGSASKKRFILRTIGANYNLKDKKLLIDLSEPFQLLQKFKKVQTLKKDICELDPRQSDTGETPSFGKGVPIWSTDKIQLRRVFSDLTSIKWFLDEELD